MPIHLTNTYVKFAYQGQRVKVKVTGAKYVSLYPVCGVVCIRLKSNLVCTHNFLCHY